MRYGRHSESAACYGYYVIVAGAKAETAIGVGPGYAGCGLPRRTEHVGKADPGRVIGYIECSSIHESPSLRLICG